MDLKEKKRLKKLELLGLFNPKEGESMMGEDVRIPASPISVAETMGMMGEDRPAPETRRQIRRELLGITTEPMEIAEPTASQPKTLGKTRYEKVNEYRTKVVRDLVGSISPELQESFYLTCYGSAVRMKNFGKPGNERQFESFQKQVEESLKEAINKTNPVAPKVLEDDYQTKNLDPEVVAKMGERRNIPDNYYEGDYYKEQTPKGDADEREMFERYHRILPLVPQRMESGETYYVAPSWGPEGYGRLWNPYLYTKEGKRVGWRVLVGLEGERLGAVITDKKVPIIRSGGGGWRKGNETVTNPGIRLLNVSFDKSLRTRPVVSDTHYGDVYSLSGDYIGSLKKERTGKVILTPEGNPIVELQPYSEKRYSAQPKTSWEWVFDSYTFGWYGEDFSRGGRTSSYAWNQPGYEGRGKIIYDWEWLKSGTKNAEDEVRKTQPKSIEEYGFPEICLYASLKNTGADLNPMKRFLAQKVKDDKVAKAKKDAEEATEKKRKKDEENRRLRSQSEQAERKAKLYPDDWEEYQDKMIFPFSEVWGPFGERTEEQHIKYSQDYARWIFGTFLSPVQKEVLITVGYGSRFNACLVSLDYFVNTPEFSEINKKRREIRDSVEPILQRAKKWVEDLVDSPRFDKPPLRHTPPDFRETHLGYFNTRERLENERENPDDPVNLGADFGSAVEGKSFRDFRPEYRSPGEMASYWRIIDASLAKFASKASLKDIKDSIEFQLGVVQVTIQNMDALLAKKTYHPDVIVMQKGAIVPNPSRDEIRRETKKTIEKPDEREETIVVEFVRGGTRYWIDEDSNLYEYKKEPLNKIGKLDEATGKIKLF
jgi:hypothetical protein